MNDVATITCKRLVHDVDKIRIVRNKLPDFLHQEVVLSYHASYASMHLPLVVVPAPQETLNRLPAPIVASLWPSHHPNTHLWVGVQLQPRLPKLPVHCVQSLQALLVLGVIVRVFSAKASPVQGMLLHKTTFILQSLATLMADMSRFTVSYEVPSTSKVTGRTKTEWALPAVAKLDCRSVQNLIRRIPKVVCSLQRPTNRSHPKQAPSKIESRRPVRNTNCETAQRLTFCMLSRPKASVLDGLRPVKVLSQKVTYICRAWNPVDHKFVLVDSILNEASFFLSLRREFALRFGHNTLCHGLQNAAS